jgi:uncharacterized protein (TIGR02118 family)
MALEDFHQHWRSRHAELIVRLLGIRRYAQNFPIDPESAYDAVAESSFDDTAAMKALARTPEYAAVLADEPDFIDRASMGSVITEEHVLRDGAAAGLKIIRLVARNDGMPIDAFFGSFLREGRTAAEAPGTLRYVQCHTRRSGYESGRVPAYDGVEMIWSEKDTAPPAMPGIFDTRRSRSLAVIERIVAG